MNKENIDWKKFAEALLLDRIIEGEDKKSEWGMNRHLELVHFPSIHSDTMIKTLTWKQLALELGLLKNNLLKDGQTYTPLSEEDIMKLLKPVYPIGDLSPYKADTLMEQIKAEWNEETYIDDITGEIIGDSSQIHISK